MMILYVLQLCAIFVVRGKPYSGEQVASALITKAQCCSSALNALLAFSWHVVSLNILYHNVDSITTIKRGLFLESTIGYAKN